VVVPHDAHSDIPDASTAHPHQRSPRGEEQTSIFPASKLFPKMKTCVTSSRAIARRARAACGFRLEPPRGVPSYCDMTKLEAIMNRFKLKSEGSARSSAPSK